MSEIFVKAVDRLERAAMAYERLGKLTRDDEKTRQIRKDTIAELASARALLLGLFTGPHELQMNPPEAWGALLAAKIADAEETMRHRAGREVA